MDKKKKQIPPEFENRSKRTDEEIMLCLEATNGNVYRAAKALGYSNCSGLYKRLNANPEMKTKLEEIRAFRVDQVEDRVFQSAIEEGNIQACKLILEARAKDRGYGNTSIDMQMKARLEHEVVVSESTLQSAISKFMKLHNLSDDEVQAEQESEEV